MPLRQKLIVLFESLELSSKSGDRVDVKVFILGKRSHLVQGCKVSTVRKVTGKRRLSTGRVRTFHGTAVNALDIASRKMRVPGARERYLVHDGGNEQIRQMARSDTSMVEVPDSSPFSSE